MYEINWNKFMLKNSNPQEAFETMCRNIFLREYKVSSHGFSSNYNQTGLETEPVLFKERYYGFQCKYSTSGNSDSLYAEVLDSLNKAVVAYPDLNTVIVYTNLNIKPNVSAVEQMKPKKSNRVRIYDLGKKNNLEIIWFVKPNFEKALNEVENYDLYRAFFSPEDTYVFLNDTLTHEERTFLQSDQFIDLSLNGKNFFGLKEEILHQKISVITGAAGTGKSEILKNLYLQCENKYLSNVKQTPSNSDVPIPFFVRLRECINGNLEELLRNRLKDFDINVASGQNDYIYFFDGLDEVTPLDFGGVIACISRLIDKPATKSLILTSRNNTSNLTTILRVFKPMVYTIDPLKVSDVYDYFNRLNDPQKQKKLQDLNDSSSSLFGDITDIFSAVLLSENIFHINGTTTKVDLIRINAEKLVENNRKYSLINLPEPKTLSVEKILSRVSELMQRTGNISVSRSDLQGITRDLFPHCNYLQIDAAIDFIAEMFFDSSGTQIFQQRYSYRHKRYFEFYLYNAIKNVFYDNPAILRELRLLSNRDFILNIFLVQELKNNILNNDVLRVLTLRFLEAYLGDNYMRNSTSPWSMPKSLLIPADDSYLQSDKLLEYLCTKNIDDLQELLRNDPLCISGFLTIDNYYSFIKQYHKAHGVDIGKCLTEIYNIQNEWKENAAQKDEGAFLYYKCVIEQESIAEIYNVIISTEDIRTVDLDYYPYTQNAINTIVDFFELAIDFFGDWLLSVINNISINDLEIISYILLRPHKLSYVIKDDELSPLAIAICSRIASNTIEQYGINTVVLYGILTSSLIQESDIETRAKNVNINHYETWRHNYELNNYVGMLLGDKFRPAHHDYKLGITLREIVHDYYPNKKDEVLPAILQEVNKFNLIYKNWFSYNNSVFIGEIIASLNIDIAEVKKFIIELRKYGSVISVFQVLYTLMRSNTELFNVIANPSLIDSEYSKASQELSYYYYNSELGFKYATMISHFDMVKSDALFEDAINNSIFRPFFRKESMLDYHLSECLLTAYNSYWLSNKEFETDIWRVNNILKIAKNTLDSGAHGEYFKYLVEHCCPQLKDIVQDLNVNADNPETSMGWESYSSTLAIENATSDDLSEYYTCKIDGINYSSISVWKELINYEMEKDDKLTILYQILEKNYFHGSAFSKINRCFHIIVAVLISNEKTRPKALDFIMKYTGRMGLVELIKTFALIGDDKSGRDYIEQLLKLCEALVYPSAEYIEKFELHNNRNSDIIDIVCCSKIGDWNQDDNMCVMYYMPNSKITIKYDQHEEQEPFNDEWATKHPDKNAYHTRYYICYEKEIIKVFDMVWVDGYRALIPMPDAITKHIDRKSYMFASLINHNLDNLNRYIITSRLIVD